MIKLLLSFMVTAVIPVAVFAADISGDWEIKSSIGDNSITVYCTLVQSDSVLSGYCTPEIENAEPSELNGNVDEASARWDYDVVFNGNPGHVEFVADTLSDSTMSGTLSLSGNPSPFTAIKQ